MRPSSVMRVLPIVLGLALGWVSSAQGATPAEILAGYKAQGGGTPSAERGQKFFTTNFGKQMGWSCSSCHGDNPMKPGKDDVSGKRIDPLAPAAQASRFTDKVKVENSLRLNCKDVVGRECTAAEKADVLAWLMSLK